MSASAQAESRNRLPVVLVHGIWNTAAIFNPLKRYLESVGWTVYTFSMTPNNGDAPIELLAEQVSTFVQGAIAPQQSFHLIGFSMGGLISRYYVQRLGGLGRIKTFITISTPHRGTLLALSSRRPGIRQMRPGSRFLTELNRDIDCLRGCSFYTLWTPFDLLILPPWSSIVGLGKTQRLCIASHNQMIRDTKGLAAIDSVLSA
ncbi:MAG: triacylglycerol lipase [Cyanobacteria bacterium J06627_28]